MIKEVGRNEPCPCGSGKKYKRCHGMTERPEPQTKSAPSSPAPMAGFDPSQMDPKAIQALSKAMKKLPKGQLLKLQGLMQKAMAGRDVSRELQSLEQSLPPDFQSMLQSMAGTMGAQTPEVPAPEMSEKDAKRIVQEALERGEISQEEADRLLQGGTEEKKGLFSKWFKK